MASVSEVLTAAASLCDKGVCRGANARLANGKPCGVFDQRAASHSMYGALCCVLGPELGGDKRLQSSAAWKLIALRAWDGATGGGQTPGVLQFALHELNDNMPGNLDRSRGDLFREWAAEPEIVALGEWH